MSKAFKQMIDSYNKLEEQMENEKLFEKNDLELQKQEVEE